jgi:hypothetical protein
MLSLFGRVMIFGKAFRCNSQDLTLHARPTDVGATVRDRYRVLCTIVEDRPGLSFRFPLAPFEQMLFERIDRDTQVLGKPLRVGLH